MCSLNKGRKVNINNLHICLKSPIIKASTSLETFKRSSFVCSDEANGVSPAEKMSPQHLQRLRNAFAAILDSRGGARNRAKSGINSKEFHQVLKSAIGPHIYQTWVERFFNEVRRMKLTLSYG